MLIYKPLPFDLQRCEVTSWSHRISELKRKIRRGMSLFFMAHVQLFQRTNRICVSTGLPSSMLIGFVFFFRKGIISFLAITNDIFPSRSANQTNVVKNAKSLVLLCVPVNSVSRSNQATKSPTSLNHYVSVVVSAQRNVPLGPLTS